MSEDKIKIFMVEYKEFIKEEISNLLDDVEDEHDGYYMFLQKIDWMKEKIQKMHDLGGYSK